jgi:site-specific DNA-methyltransferase (adenine-specific)
MIPISEVYNMDCVAFMREYPDKFFDLAICDPPYGIGITKHKSGMGRRKGDEKAKYKIGNWDNEIPTIEYFTELFRVSKNQIIWGGNYFDLPPTKCFLIWDKLFSNEVSFAACEYAWTSFNSTAKIFKLSTQQQNRLHPTQKPVKLYEWLLKNNAQKGDRILDTHLGSGSSRIAAQKLGFDFYGCEIDKDYFNQSEKRFKDAISMPLFDKPVYVPQQLVLV